MKVSGTLTALVEDANFNLRWFNLGRRLQPVSKSTAEAFETGQKPWPYPYLRQAWTGFLMQPTEGGEPAVWFLRFPLDEQGKLQLQARDGLLRALAQELQQGPASESAVQLDKLLQHSGLMYTPSTERLAAFHAHTGILLLRPPSAHYELVLRYCLGPQQHRWDNLALQGIADLAARWESQKAMLVRQVAHIAAPVFINLCHCLENESVDHQLTEAIIARAESTLRGDSPDLTVVAAAIRGTSHSPAKGLRQALLLQLLQSPSTAQSTELLAAVGSRCALDLENPELARLWLNALARTEDQGTFNLLLSDLMFLPQVRTSLLGALRDPAREEVLAQVFGNFLHGSKPTH